MTHANQNQKKKQSHSGKILLHNKIVVYNTMVEGERSLTTIKGSEKWHIFWIDIHWVFCLRRTIFSASTLVNVAFPEEVRKYLTKY